MRVFILLIFLAIISPLKAQLLIPVFEEPVLMDKLSDRSNESSVITYNSGEGMFFNRTYESLNEDKEMITAEDVWFAEKGKKGWGRPYRLFRDVDYRKINFFIGASQDGNTVYLIRRMFVGDSIVSEIVSRERKGRNFHEEETIIPIPGLKLDSVQSTVFMHSSGEVFFISQAIDDEGKNEDLFISIKDENGKWSELQALGYPINTPFLEFSPFLTHDKTTLYFASTGHDGFGGADIFISYRQGDGWDNWTKPMNLGLPINSSAYEGDFLISDSSQIYFTSDRESESVDIYYTRATGDYRIEERGILSGRYLKDQTPLAGIRFNVYDPAGRFLETIMTDEKGEFTFTKLHPDDQFTIELDTAIDENLFGSKLYLTDASGTLVERRTFSDSGQFVYDSKIQGKKIIQGFFKKGGIGLYNMALIVEDENGFPIDTIYTDETGFFKYEQLANDLEVQFIPRDVDENDLVDYELFAVNESGEKSADFLKQSFESGKGRFIYNSLPFANTSIKVLNDAGEVVEVLVFNQNGSFTYKKLAMDDDGVFRIVADDGSDLIGGILYLESDNGQKRRFIVAENNEAREIDAAAKENIYGVYMQNETALANSSLLISDKNGVGLDTIKTGQDGAYTYSKSVLDESIQISPIGLDYSQGGYTMSYGLDQESLSLLEYDKTKNSYLSSKRTIVVVNQDMAAKNAEPEEKKVTAVSVSNNTSKKPAIKPVMTVPTLSKIYFDFNTANLKEKAALNAWIAYLKSQPNQKISIEGHTDDKGSDAVNMKMGKDRANAVAAYFKSKGVSSQQVIISSKGESSPIASNETEEGRAQNRRVELSLMP